MLLSPKGSKSKVDLKVLAPSQLKIHNCLYLIGHYYIEALYILLATI